MFQNTFLSGDLIFYIDKEAKVSKLFSERVFRDYLMVRALMISNRFQKIKIKKN